jgi:hypothetical protein
LFHIKYIQIQNNHQSGSNQSSGWYMSVFELKYSVFQFRYDLKIILIIVIKILIGNINLSKIFLMNCIFIVICIIPVRYQKWGTEWLSLWIMEHTFGCLKPKIYFILMHELMFVMFWKRSTSVLYNIKTILVSRHEIHQASCSHLWYVSSVLSILLKFLPNFFKLLNDIKNIQVTMEIVINHDSTY